MLVNWTVNRWSAVFAWAVGMLIVWALFVPGRLSAGTFTMLAGGGILMLLAGSALWRAQRPAPSIRQMRAMAETADAPRPRS